MVAKTVKVPAEAHAKLVELAAAEDVSLGELIAELIEQRRRQRLFDEADAALLRLQADPTAWADYQAEIQSMEGTLMDGLEDDPWIE